MALVEESLAACRTTEAGNTVIAVPLSFELVIVSQLLIWRKENKVSMCAAG